MNLFAAYHGTSPEHVDFTATVTSPPRFFMGNRTHCEHEAFDIRTPAGPAEVVDNVAIAPRVPVAAGDLVEICGEMVHDPGKLPIVHWTHHDPDHDHVGGFIRFHGRVYA